MRDALKKRNINRTVQLTSNVVGGMPKVCFLHRFTCPAMARLGKEQKTHLLSIHGTQNQCENAISREIES